jgi:F-type H+-transporting ATPase subunit epsilon
MAEKNFHVKLITPEARLLDAEVHYASVPMWDGQRGEMHRSAAVVGKLGPGVLRLDMPANAGSKAFFIEGGFMQNVADELTILAEAATPVESIDAAEVKAELAEAMARTPQSPDETDQINDDRDRLRKKLAAASTR